jgi:N-acetylneuraminic acid mutarotase
LGFASLVSTALVICLLAGATIVEAREATWSATGSLGTVHNGPAATLLANGKVLLVGGVSGGTGIAEHYDPATGTWSFTGNLNTTRTWPSATLLPNGKVLVAGGWDSNARPLNSAELYDPPTGTWSYTGNLNTAGGGAATLLPSGKVLVVAGNSAELYDPGTGTWRSTGNLNKAHTYSGVVTLRNGKVLIVGGNGVDASNSAEVYDLATETWSVTGNLNVGRRYGHSATLLPNGKVLVAAGFDGDDWIDSAELYDPVTGTWSETGDLNGDRGIHTATLLPNGKVLVAGGYYDDTLNSAELYDPDTESWSVTGSLNTARAEHTATLLANGKVLVAGGDSGGEIHTTSAELFDSGNTPVVEYHYAAWDHYFITSSPGEIAALDGGAFGGVWQRTGQTFNAWSDASGGALPTCRFFSTGFAPKSSHFYTPYAAECAAVKNDPNWQYESIAFYLQLPDANGNCPIGTTALYRLYNNGMGGAPNHRYTTSVTVFNQMSAAGWVFEGNANTKAFACVPQ